MLAQSVVTKIVQGRVSERALICDSEYIIIWPMSYTLGCGLFI